MRGFREKEHTKLPHARTVTTGLRVSTIAQEDKDSHVQGHYVNEDVDNVLGSGQDTVILQCAPTPTLSVHAQRPETRLTANTIQIIHKAGANCPV